MLATADLYYGRRGKTCHPRFMFEMFNKGNVAKNFGLLVVAAMAAQCLACDDPGIQIVFNVPEPYRDEVVSSSLQILMPPDGEPFGCEDLAFRAVDEDVLRANLSQEIFIEAGEDVRLAGIERVAPKVIVARGFDVYGAAAVVGCERIGEINEHVRVTIDGEPTAMATISDRVADGGDNNLPTEVHLTITDIFSEPMAGAEARWTAVGPGGETLAGSEFSDPEGKIVAHPQSPAQPGPAVLEFEPRWQRGVVPLIKGFRTPPKLSAMLPEIDWELLAFHSFTFGRIGPNGEFGIAAIVNNDDARDCDADFDECLDACDQMDDECIYPCYDDWDSCKEGGEGSRSLVYRYADSTATDLEAGRIDFDLGDGETNHWPVLGSVPDEGRDRLIIVAKKSWREFDAKGERLIDRAYADPFQQDRVPLALYPADSCLDGDSDPPVAIVYKNGSVGMYGADTGAAISDHPLLELNEFIDDPLFIVSTGCVADQTGRTENRMYIAYSEYGDQAAIAQVRDGLEYFWLTQLVTGVSFAASLRPEEPASVMLGRLGQSSPEVARYNLIDQQGIDEIRMNLLGSDPVVTTPMAVASGDVDGHLDAEIRRDVVALVFIPDTYGFYEDYAQTILGSEHRGERISGMMPLGTSVNQPLLWIGDFDANGVDDLFIVRFTKITSGGRTNEKGAILDIYLMGS